MAETAGNRRTTAARRHKQHRSRSASLQPVPVLEWSLLLQGRGALKRARAWQHVAGIRRCCHQESCLRGQTRTEVRASLQVTRRGWRETSVVMHKASSVLGVWERGKRGPFFLCCIAPCLFSACWNTPIISESVTASCLRQSSKSHPRQREGPRFWLNPKPDRSYYPFCLLFKYAWIIIDFNIRYWKICKFQ